MRWLDGITDSMDRNSSTLQEMGRTEEPGVLRPMNLHRVGHDLVAEQQQQQSSLKSSEESEHNIENGWKNG